MVTLTLPACGLAFLILYAVTGRVSAETCKIDGGYNYESLISSIWLTELEGKDCRYNTASPCSWILQFCNKVPLNPCGVNTACEVKEELKEPHPLGSFTQLLANGPNSFIAQFEGKYTGVPNCNNTKITTNVVFECDPNKHISVGNDTLVGKLVASKVVTDPKDQCMKNMTVLFSGACGTKPSTAAGLSGGSVILILFFVGVLLYLVGGVLLNHSNGARGWEMLPHYQFWSELPSLIVEGCVFFVKFITCQAGAGGGNRSYDNI